MTQTCPTCGGPVPPTRTSVCLETNTLLHRSELFKLRPQQAEALHILLAARPKAARHDQLIANLWGIDNRDRDELAHVRVLICRLRRLLRPLGIEIIRHSGVGYSVRLPETDKIREAA